MSSKHSQEDIIFISDDRTWVSAFTYAVLDTTGKKYVKLATAMPIRQSWQRLRDSEFLLIHWEGRDRRGGAIVEEILDVDPSLDISNKLIVVTTDPTREDVVYFSELGIKKILRLRNNKRYYEQNEKTLKSFLFEPAKESPLNLAWRKIIKLIDMAPNELDEKKQKDLMLKLAKLRKAEGKDSARYLDLKGVILLKSGEIEQAEDHFYQALDQNSNYYRAYTNLVKLYSQTKKLDSAIALCKKLHSLNRDNISRLVDMGDLHYEKGEEDRAESCYNEALKKDEFCSRALNGKAQIHFNRGEIEESREYLSRSKLAYKLAKHLNEEGIRLVASERYEEALEHYSKAQFVIPMQDKGPMLFYNIGLCYSRWGKYEMAKEFLKLALIKEPNYKKARKLLQHIDERSQAAEQVA